MTNNTKRTSGKDKMQSLAWNKKIQVKHRVSQAVAITEEYINSLNTMGLSFVIYEYGSHADIDNPFYHDVAPFYSICAYEKVGKCDNVRIAKRGEHSGVEDYKFPVIMRRTANNPVDALRIVDSMIRYMNQYVGYVYNRKRKKVSSNKVNFFAVGDATIQESRAAIITDAMLAEYMRYGIISEQPKQLVNGKRYNRTRHEKLLYRALATGQVAKDKNQYIVFWA